MILSYFHISPFTQNTLDVSPYMLILHKHYKVGEENELFLKYQIFCTRDEELVLLLRLTNYRYQQPDQYNYIRGVLGRKFKIDSLYGLSLKTNSQ